MESTILKQLSSLQQGSDIRGIAMEGHRDHRSVQITLVAPLGIPDEAITLTPAAIYFIIVGYARWLQQRTQKSSKELKVSIGRDPRLSGELVQSSATLGLISEGISVTNFGLASTPAMFMSCIMEDYKFDGALMLTASHLPYNRNGIKFFDKNGGLDKIDIKSIVQLATETCLEMNVDLNDANQVTSFLLQRAMECSTDGVRSLEFMPVYAQHLQTIIKQSINSETNYDRPLTGFKIAVDAGNGSGGFVATQVLEPLGADISGSQFLEPDGKFPNHIPNPEEPAAAAAGTEAVLKSSSDLGVIYDTDVDRSGVIDGTAIVLREHPGTTIVTDSVTSNGLKEFIESQGGKHFRYKRGYKNVIGKGVELNEQGQNCELMMETSGHGALRENYFMDDGAYMSLKIIVEMVRRKNQGQGSIGDLIGTLKEPLEAQEFRIRISSPDFKEIAMETTENFRQFVESGVIQRWKMEDENYEGWRVIVNEGNDKRGWCLLRPSIHDPLCVLNIESEVKGGNH
eukprot:g3135.t1